MSSESNDVYLQAHDLSISNPDKFWAEVAGELHWTRQVVKAMLFSCVFVGMGRFVSYGGRVCGGTGKRHALG